MGRPDMAYFSFTQKYFAGEPIRVFNNGDFDNDLYRDFTYIDDIVDGTVKSMNLTGYNIINLGNNKPSQLNRLIQLIEVKLNKLA